MQTPGPTASGASFHVTRHGNPNSTAPSSEKDARTRKITQETPLKSVSGSNKRDSLFSMTYKKFYLNPCFG